MAHTRADSWSGSEGVLPSGGGEAGLWVPRTVSRPLSRAFAAARPRYLDRAALGRRHRLTGAGRSQSRPPTAIRRRSCPTAEDRQPPLVSVGRVLEPHRLKSVSGSRREGRRRTRRMPESRVAAAAALSGGV